MLGTAKQNQACRPDYKYSDHFHWLVSLVWYLPLMADHTHRGRVLCNHKMGMAKKEGGEPSQTWNQRSASKEGLGGGSCLLRRLNRRTAKLRCLISYMLPGPSWFNDVQLLSLEVSLEKMSFTLYYSLPSLTGRFKGQISDTAQTAISSNNYHAQWHNVHSRPNMANNSTNRTRTVCITVSPFTCQEFDHMDKATTFVSLIFPSFNRLLCGKNIRIATVSCSGLLQYVQLEGCQPVKQTMTVFPVHYIPLIHPASLHIRI